MKLLTFIFINIFFLNSFCDITSNVLVISIPKSGTNLLINYLNKLTNKKLQSFSFSIPSLQQIKLQNNHIFSTHIKYTQSNKDQLAPLGFKTFFIYRDPRDQLISWLFWAKKKLSENPKFYQELSLNPMAHKEVQPSYAVYEKLSLNEQITALITQGSAYYDGLGHYLGKEHTTKGIAEFYNSYLQWMNHKDICVIKFENLIGAQGGGSKELQNIEIKKIAEHLQINLTDSEIENLIKTIFGGTHTFREGKIGSWKNYFTPEHKQMFKNIAGDLLIKLNYEKDFNW